MTPSIHTSTPKLWFSHLRFVPLVFLLNLWNCSSQSPKEPNISIDPRPNILLVVVDDLGKAFLSTYNAAAAPTPNLDHWADQGLKFNNFYVTSPVCSPSRATIITGQPAAINGVSKVLKPGKAGEISELADGTPTLAKGLQQNGYRTALIGKWHLGYKPKNHPLERGFDTFRGFLSGHVDYISHVDASNSFGLSRDREEWTPDKAPHLTRLLTTEAIDYIEDSAAEAQPYFMMLAYANPHTPYLLPGEEAIFPRKSVLRKLYTRDRYVAMIELLDQEVGRLQNTLREQARPTVVIFISDNGDSLYNHEHKGPQKRGKGTLYESGINVPAFLYYPDRVAPATVEGMYAAFDLYPTLLAIAGATTIPANLVSKVNLLHADTTDGHPYFTTTFSEAHSIRKGVWKAIFVPRDQPRIVRRYFGDKLPSQDQKFTEVDERYFPLLYNLAHDPDENHNLAVEQPEIVQELWELCLPPN